ncbi:hypothetical protein K2Q00_00605 [Patescibacteria group bacterium]|nr:hypothetical protein [Patescibacteria group bacterium]
MRKLSSLFVTFFLAACTAGSYIASIVVSEFGNAGSDLQTFYVEGFSRTLFSVSIFFALCAAASLTYASSPVFRNRLSNVWAHLQHYFEGSLFRYAILSFGSAAAFLFALNAPGIIHGTFLIDDYGMYAIAVQKTPWQLFWTPINDHVIPLFWLELKTIFTFIGTNPPLLNFPLFLPAIVAIGAAGVLLRQLGFGLGTLAGLLILFGSTTIVSHQLYGFYAVAPYFQVLALLTLSLVCFTHARQSTRYPKPYFTASLILIVVCVLIESGGIWAPLALALFAVAYQLSKKEILSIESIWKAVKKEKLMVFLSVLITAVYVGYLVVIPYFSDASFYGPDRLPISIASIYELYKVLTAGVLSSFLMPRMGLILSQPRFENVEILWHLGMLLLFVAAAYIFWWASVRGTIRSRVWGLYFLMLSLGTSLLVAIARPSSHAVSFYRDQNLLFPLFFISLAFVVIGYEWVRSASNERGKEIRISAVVAVCVLVFGCQMVFSFYKDQYLGDIYFNNSLITELQETLVPALNELSAQHPSLPIPVIGGAFLGSSAYQLPNLSAFSFFLGIRDVVWITPGTNAATSSMVFADALRHDERLRMWYLAPGEISETCSTEVTGTDTRELIPEKPLVVIPSVDTAKSGKLTFGIIAKEAPEKILIDISFKNDFGATSTLATIRLDQYTLRAQGKDRRYACAINLNDIPAYALSRTVRTISFTVRTPGTYDVSARFLQSGERLPSDTKRN